MAGEKTGVRIAHEKKRIFFLEKIASRYNLQPMKEATKAKISNVNQITVGAVIKSRGMEMTVTGSDKRGFVGFWTARNGDRVKITLPLSVIDNPHYVITHA
jgi:hypothetical protein